MAAHAHMGRAIREIAGCKKVLQQAKKDASQSCELLLNDGWHVLCFALTGQ